MVYDSEKDNYKQDSIEADSESKETRSRKGFAQETVLELAENDKGQIVLRDTSNSEDPLVTIDFSSKVQDVLGSDIQFIGHQMVHAAIQAVMQKQFSQWHANVYDEQPEHFS